MNPARPPARPRCAVAAAAALLWVPGAPAAPSQTPVPTTMTAHVANERGEPMGGLEVLILVVDAEKQVADQLEGTTDAEGVARFEDVAVAPGYSAWAVSSFETAPYQGEPVNLTPGVEATLPVTVYTVSDAPVNLHIQVLHIIINTIEPGSYQAIQVMSVLNVGEQAGFSPQKYQGRSVGMEIPVPDGATSVAPIPQFSGLDAENLAIDGNRLLDLRPVSPGDHQIAVQYELQTGDEGREITLSVPYPTAEVSILVGPGLGLTAIESDQLTELEPVSIPDQGEYANYGSDVLDAGEALRFRLGPPAAPISPGAWALLALAAALFAGAAASIWGGRRKSAGGAEQTPREERDRLIGQVARLDDQHAAGTLSEADYETRRAAAIERILDIDERAGGAHGPTGA